MQKLVQSTVQFPNTFEPTVQLVTPQRGMLKLAQHSHHCQEIADFLNSVKSEEGKSYVLILALGASDFYGCNRNGDWFDESELLNCYKTFETEPAYLYRHHQNKDPERACGVVTKSFYNPIMHRVEIIVKLDNDKARDVIEKLQEGVPVATSMGCRVQYDECSKCYNKAKTRFEYCDHLKHQMRQIDNDGTQVYAINKYPKFFDISLVFRPADRTSYVLKKVASDVASGSNAEGYSGVSSAFLNDISVKTSELRKLSDIIKAIKGYPVRYIRGSDDEAGRIDAPVVTSFAENRLPSLMRDHKEIPDSALDEMRSLPITDVVQGLGEHGYSLTTPELSKLVTAKQQGVSCSNVSDLYGRILSMLSFPLIDALSKRENLISQTLSSPEFESSPESSHIKITAIIRRLPTERRWGDNDLLQKSASQYPQYRPGFMEVVHAARDLTSLDGPGNYETVTMRLPNGTEWVVPRREILKNIVTGYGKRGPFTVLPSPVGIPAILLGMATSLIPRRKYYYDYNKLPIQDSQVGFLGGLQGRMIKGASQEGLGLMGNLVKIGMDQSLSGNYFLPYDFEKLSSLSDEKFLEKINSFVCNVVRNLVSEF